MEEIKKKLPISLEEMLKKPLPSAAIKQHSQKKYLSTIDPAYIIERLNDVFGIGGWHVEHEIILSNDSQIVVRGRLEIPHYEIKTSYQYGGWQDKNEKMEIGDRYKAAVTDCFGKCASYLGIGLDVYKGIQKPKQESQQKTNQTTREPDVSNEELTNSDIPF